MFCLSPTRRIAGQDSLSFLGLPLHVMVSLAGQKCFSFMRSYLSVVGLNTCPEGPFLHLCFLSYYLTFLLVASGFTLRSLIHLPNLLKTEPRRPDGIAWNSQEMQECLWRPSNCCVISLLTFSSQVLCDVIVLKWCDMPGSGSGSRTPSYLNSSSEGFASPWIHPKLLMLDLFYFPPERDNVQGVAGLVQGHAVNPLYGYIIGQLRARNFSERNT